ncbi:MAG: hypothetical protein JXR96_25955 [Deltaproteobacteria bacterium]|nr:hypothetical protein [Deltaproteobacteria bacterium]
MRARIRLPAYAILTSLLLGPAPFSWAGSAFRVVRYRLEVSLDPDAHSLEATCTFRVINEGEATRTLDFGLHRDVKIHEVRAGAQPLLCSPAKDWSIIFCPTSVGHRVVLGEPIPKGGQIEVTLRYGGKYEGMINDVNCLGPDLVELDFYAGWYPLFDSTKPYAIELCAELPSRMSAFSTGRHTSSESAPGRTRHCWMTDAAISVLLFAAPDLHTRESTCGKSRLQVVYRTLPAAYLDALMEYADKALALFVQSYGQLGDQKQELIVIYSPRGGWGYSRLPVIVGPGEKIAEKYTPQSADSIHRIRGIVHEAGHFWWHGADTSTFEDWMNESLAEYSSLFFTERFFGQEAADRIWRSFARRITATIGSKPIVETRRSDRFGYILFYDKGAYIMRMLRQELGDERFFRLLRDFLDPGVERSTRSFRQLLARLDEPGSDYLVRFLDQWITRNDLATLGAEWTPRPEGRGWRIRGEVIQSTVPAGSPPLLGTVALRAYGPGEQICDASVQMRGAARTPFSFTCPFDPSRVAVNPDGRFLAFEAGGDDLGVAFETLRRDSIDWPHGTAYTGSGYQTNLLAPSTIFRMGGERAVLGAATSILLDGMGVPNLELKLTPFDMGFVSLGMQSDYLCAATSEPRVHFLQGSLIASGMVNFVRPLETYVNLSLGIFLEAYGEKLEQDGWGMWLSSQWQIAKRFLIHVLWRRDFSQGSNGWEVRGIVRLSDFLLSAGILTGHANSLTRFTFLRDDIPWEVMPFVDLGYLW